MTFKTALLKIKALVISPKCPQFFSLMVCLDKVFKWSNSFFWRI